MFDAFERFSLGGMSQHRWLILLVLLFAMQPSAHASDDTLKMSLKRYSERMSALAVQLDRLSAIGERASRIVGGAGSVSRAARSVVHSDVSKSAEINMVQLQSLVSQRSQATQLTVSMLEQLNEQMKNIAKNIGGSGAGGAHGKSIGLT